MTDQQAEGPAPPSPNISHIPISVPNYAGGGYPDFDAEPSDFVNNNYGADSRAQPQGDGTEWDGGFNVQT
jgi:hypothetical protein